MAHSVKTNYILNLINTGSQMLFPLITFPYACRVIEADGIGQVNFFSSIIGYITLFTCLGIPMYAIREIARERDDIVKMNRTAIEILTLHTLLTVAGYIIVVLLCLFVPQIKTDIPLFLVLSLTIFFTAIGCEWFYQGIEDFKYITIRGLIVKAISCILLFVLVKTKEDLLYYGLYTVIGILGGNIFNFFRLRKYIHREKIIFSKLNIRRHLKPVLQVFSLNIVTSVYLQLNPVLLGFMKTTLAVGYFTAATKIVMMIMKLSSSLGTVMMPRISNLIAQNKEDEFKILIQKSYDLTLAACLPLTAGLIFTAPYIITILCGAEFSPAITASQIIAPIILMVGISNVMGTQVLYPKGKINIVIKSCLIGAMADLLLNVCLISTLSYDGTAIAYFGAEIATTVSMYFLAKEYIPLRFMRLNHLNYLVGSFIMSAVLFFIPILVKWSAFYIFLTQIIAGIATYSIYLLIRKDTFVLQTLSKLKK